MTDKVLHSVHRSLPIMVGYSIESETGLINNSHIYIIQHGSWEQQCMHGHHFWDTGSFVWLYMGIYGLTYVFWMSGLVFRCLDLYFGCLDFILLVFGLVLGCLVLICRCLDLYSSGYCIPVVCLYSCWVSVYL